MDKNPYLLREQGLMSDWITVTLAEEEYLALGSPCVNLGTCLDGYCNAS